MDGFLNNWYEDYMVENYYEWEMKNVMLFQKNSVYANDLVIGNPWVVTTLCTIGTTHEEGGQYVDSQIFMR